MRGAAIVIAALSFAAAPALAQSAAPRTTHDARDLPTKRLGPADFQKLARQAAAAYASGEYDAAERALREQLAAQPDNTSVRYNLALCLGAAGKDADAAATLLEVIDGGFSNLARIEREPALRGAREDDRIAALRGDWPAVLNRQRDNVLALAREDFPGCKREVIDDDLRIVILSSHSAQAVERTRRDLARVASWASWLSAGGKADVPDPWVVVVLPPKPEFRAWAARSFGALARGSFSQVGGSYDNARKRLVALDAGPTLRHEFVHILQFRAGERLGQEYPIWILEGIASLAEDMDPARDGLSPAQSWRTNIARRSLKSGVLAGFADLAAMNQTQFQQPRPLVNYAAARAFFLFLNSEGRLPAFWKDYASGGYEEDRTGVTSIERVLEMNARDVQTRFETWLRLLPDVNEEVPPGGASLGADVEAREGEGVVISAVVGNKPNGLRRRDVLQEIDGRPIRDIGELIRVLGNYHPGTRVPVVVQRGNSEVEVELELRAAR